MMRRTRLWLALALTLVVTGLPAIAGVIEHALSGDRFDPALIAAVTVLFGVPCALAWIVAGAYFAVKVDRASVGGGEGICLTNPEALRLVLSEHDVVCANCGYNLRGLPPGACPECQEPIRLYLNSPGASRLTRVIVLVLAACALRLVWGTLYLASDVQLWTRLGGTSLPPQLRTQFLVGVAAHSGGVILLLALAVPAAAWIRARGAGARTAARWRISWMASAALALVMVLDLTTLLFRWLL